MAAALRLSHRAFTFQRAPRVPTPELQRSCHLHKSSPFSIIAYQHPSAIHTDSDTKLYDQSSTQERGTQIRTPQTQTITPTPRLQNTRDGREQPYQGVQCTQLAFLTHPCCQSHCAHPKRASQHQHQQPRCDFEQRHCCCDTISGRHFSTAAGKSAGSSTGAQRSDLWVSDRG